MTGRPPRATAWLVRAVASFLVAACSTGPTGPPPAGPGRLVSAIAGDPGHTLVRVDATGNVTTLALPPAEPVIVATAVDGRLAVGTAERRIFRSGAGGSTWSEVARNAVPPEGADADLLLPAWSPDGRLAVLFADTEGVRTVGVLVTDTEQRQGSWVPLVTGFGGHAPSWIGPDRLAVPTRDDGGGPTLTTLQLPSGDLLAVVDGPRALVASADGSTLAVLSADGRTIELWAADAWAAGDEARRLAVLGPDWGDAGIDGLALDPTGRHLAVALSIRDLTEAASIRVFSAASAWRTPAEVDLGPGVATSLGWVP